MRISSGAMPVWNGALEEPVERHDPLAPRRAEDDRVVERQASAGRSQAGSAWAIAPPTVPRLRTWTSPMPLDGTRATIGERSSRPAHSA